MMTYSEFQKFRSKINKKVRTRHPALREGQALYNYVYQYSNDPEWKNMKVFQNRNVDPFYLDRNIPNFWSELEKELLGNV